MIWRLRLRFHVTIQLPRLPSQNLPLIQPLRPKSRAIGHLTPARFVYGEIWRTLLSLAIAGDSGFLFTKIWNWIGYAQFGIHILLFCWFIFLIQDDYCCGEVTGCILLWPWKLKVSRGNLGHYEWFFDFFHTYLISIQVTSLSVLIILFWLIFNLFCVLIIIKSLLWSSLLNNLSGYN